MTQRIRRFKKDRRLVVNHAIADWVRENDIKVIFIETTDCGRDRISADVRYEVKE